MLFECQTLWLQIRTDRMLVLIRVQTVCKGYQQTTNVTTCKEGGVGLMKHTKYETCVILHRLHIVYIFWHCNFVSLLFAFNKIRFSYVKTHIILIFCLIWFFKSVNNFSVMWGWVFLGWTSTKQPTPRSRVKHSTTEPSLSPIIYWEGKYHGK